MTVLARVGLWTAALLVLGIVIFGKALIIRDCGLMVALLKGSEWFWLFGACK